MKSFDPHDLKTGMQVLQAKLEGESWFYDSIQARALAHLQTKPGKAEAQLSRDEFPTLASAHGTEHLTKLAQFFFSLHALDCTSEQQIATLLKRHNEGLEAMLKEGSSISKGELKKANFSDRRVKQVVRTIQHFNSPVFAVSELSSLLSSLMAPRTTENLIMDLLLGGIMVQRGTGQEDIPKDTDPRRVLVEPAEGFIETYAKSLVRTHELIVDSMDRR